MAKNKWSVSLDNDNHLKFAYGDQSSVTLSETGEVINSFSTMEPINAIEHLYDIPNRDDAKITPLLLLQSQGDETFKFVPTTDLNMQLDELVDIDFTNAAVSDTVLISDGDGTYSFRNTLFSHLKDIDHTTAGNNGFVLTDVGTGIWEWQQPELKKLFDVSLEAQDLLKENDPTDTAGLVLTTDGLNGFNFQIPTADFNNLTSIVWGASPDPKTNAGLVLTSMGGSLYQFVTPTAEFTDLLGIDWYTNDPLTEPGKVLTSGPNPNEFTWEIPSSDLKDTTGLDWITNDPYTFSGLHLSSYIDPVTGAHSFRWSFADFNDLYNIDFVTNDPHNIDGLVMTSNGDKTYNWRTPMVEFGPTGIYNLDWVTNNPYATTGVHLTSYIDPTTGMQSFRWEHPNFLDNQNIDFDTNTPNNMPGLVMTSKGSNQYGFERATVDFSPTGTITNIDWSTSIGPDLVLTSTGTNYEWKAVQRRLEVLEDVNVDATTFRTPNLILKTTAAGICEFVEPIETLRSLLDVVQGSTAPDPITDEGLVLTSIGLGTDTYEFRYPNIKTDYIIGWNPANDNTVGGVLTVSSAGNFEFRMPALATLDDVNVTNAVTPNTVLMSDTLGNYSFQNINMNHLLDVDYTNKSNNNWTLSSDGDGTYSFKQPLLKTTEDVDTLTNDPRNVDDLVMTSKGDGTFGFKKLDFDSFASVTTTGAGAGYIMITDGSDNFSFIQPLMRTLQDVTNGTTAGSEINWVLASNGNGTFSFKDLANNLFNRRWEDFDYDTTTHPVTGTTYAPTTTQNLVFVTDGDETYSFKFPTLDFLVDIDDTTNNPKTTENLVLTSTGTNGTYMFKEAEPRIQNLRNLDTSTNNPDIVPNLVLTSKGDGTYHFSTFNEFNNLPDVDTITNSPKTTANKIMISTGTGNATDPYYKFVDQELEYATDVDFTDSTNPDYVLTSRGGGAYNFVDPNTIVSKTLVGLTDIDFTPDGVDDYKTVTGLVLSSDGLGGFNFRNPSDWMTRLDNLYDTNTTSLDEGLGVPVRADRNFVDPVNPALGPSSTATQGLILKSNGDATYSFIYPELRLQVDLDMVTNDPLTTEGLFLLTDGDGEFYFGSSIPASLTVKDIQIGVSADNEIDTISMDLILDSATGQTIIDDDVSVSGSVVIGGDLSVQGTTTTVNSTTVTIDDPVFTLGGDTDQAAPDTMDRGIEYRWHDGTDPKLGFFGWDKTAQAFTFIPDATNVAEEFSGTPGDLLISDIDSQNVTIAETATVKDAIIQETATLRERPVATEDFALVMAIALG